MKAKIITITSLIGLFAILLLLINSYSHKLHDHQNTQREYYQVVAQHDLILTGIVKTKSIQNLDISSEANLSVANGDHVTEGQELSSTGDDAPISGIFTTNPDNSFSIVSDEQFVTGSVNEFDKNLLKQGMAVKVASLDGAQHYPNATIEQIATLPDDNNSNISKYNVLVSINNAPIGQHVHIAVKNPEVLLPKAYLNHDHVVIKKPGSHQWHTITINSVEKGGFYYTSSDLIPIGSTLRR